MRSEHWVRENEELRWYHRDSGCELGERAAPLGQGGGGAPHEVQEPTHEMLVAARRAAIYRRALECLTPNEQAVLRVAYASSTRVVHELMARHGAAAAVVMVVAKARRGEDVVERAVEAMRAAQGHYEVVRREQRAADEADLRQARAEGTARRQVLLAKLTDQETTARVRAQAQLEEVADVMRRAAEVFGW